MRETVVLLDVDGVLIQPRGYRASVNASMRYLFERMGIVVDTPVEQISSCFEAIGITCEWDMTALLTAIVLDVVAGRGVTPPVAADIPAMVAWARAQNLGHVEVDFTAEIGRFQRCLGSHAVPAEAVYRARENGAALFSNLNDAPFLKELLCETRLLRKSLTSKLVQNFALGADLFERVYACPALVSTGSLLEEHDLTALDPQVAAWLMQQRATGKLRIAILTARPSLAPLDAGEDADGLVGYAPEAELALEMVGLRGVPVIGYGRLQWLAEKTGADPDTTMKPCGVHALAALRAALTGEEAASLLWAADIEAGRADGNGAGIPPVLDVHIFEDSTVGIRAGQRACEILGSHGYDIRLRCWGVTRHAEKAAALRGVGAAVYEDVNQAMGAAFGLAVERDA